MTVDNDNQPRARLVIKPGAICVRCGSDETIKTCNSPDWFCFGCGAYFDPKLEKQKFAETEQMNLFGDRQD